MNSTTCKLYRNNYTEEDRIEMKCTLDIIITAVCDGGVILPFRKEEALEIVNFSCMYRHNIVK